MVVWGSWSEFTLIIWSLYAPGHLSGVTTPRDNDGWVPCPVLDGHSSSIDHIPVIVLEFNGPGASADSWSCGATGMAGDVRPVISPSCSRQVQAFYTHLLECVKRSSVLPHRNGGPVSYLRLHGLGPHVVVPVPRTVLFLGEWVHLFLARCFKTLRYGQASLGGAGD
jgi:hypothetical protein